MRPRHLWIRYPQGASFKLQDKMNFEKQMRQAIDAQQEHGGFWYVEAVASSSIWKTATSVLHKYEQAGFSSGIRELCADGLRLYDQPLFRETKILSNNALFCKGIHKKCNGHPEDMHLRNYYREYSYWNPVYPKPFVDRIIQLFKETAHKTYNFRSIINMKDTGMRQEKVSELSLIHI